MNRQAINYRHDAVNVDERPFGLGDVFVAVLNKVGSHDDEAEEDDRAVGGRVPFWGNGRRDDEDHRQQEHAQDVQNVGEAENLEHAARDLAGGPLALGADEIEDAVAAREEHCSLQQEGRNI